jgi:hypothetical protein
MKNYILLGFLLLFMTPINSQSNDDPCGCTTTRTVRKYYDLAMSHTGDVQCASYCAYIALYTCLSNCKGLPSVTVDSARLAVESMSDVAKQMGCDCDIPPSLGSNLTYSSSSSDKNKKEKISKSNKGADQSSPYDNNDDDFFGKTKGDNPKNSEKKEIVESENGLDKSSSYSNSNDDFFGKTKGDNPKNSERREMSKSNNNSAQSFPYDNNDATFFGKTKKAAPSRRQDLQKEEISFNTNEGDDFWGEEKTDNKTSSIVANNDKCSEWASFAPHGTGQAANIYIKDCEYESGDSGYFLLKNDNNVAVRISIELTFYDGSVWKSSAHIEALSETGGHSCYSCAKKNGGLKSWALTQMAFKGEEGYW